MWHLLSLAKSKRLFSKYEILIKYTRTFSSSFNNSNPIYENLIHLNGYIKSILLKELASRLDYMQKKESIISI
jgi:hypothetical protein